MAKTRIETENKIKLRASGGKKRTHEINATSDGKSSKKNGARKWKELAQVYKKRMKILRAEYFEV